jgi:hypothetical protein
VSDYGTIRRGLELLGSWEPLTPQEAADLFRNFEAPWWIAGGWAIDAFLGHQSREHGDTDISVLRRDQLAAQSQLGSWDLHAADPPGTLRPWLPGETLPPSVQDIWCRPSPDEPWRLQLMLDEAEGPIWQFRRNPAIKRSLASMIWERDGIPYLAVEVQLLYKATATIMLPKSIADFEACLPLLGEEQRRWLALTLPIAYPGHPWLERL